MKPKLENWTIVLAGAWNVRVFSPEWVGRRLLDGRPMSIEVPIGPAPLHFRYTADGLNLLPSSDRLIIGVHKADLVSLQKAEATAKKALELLPHTPISALGINLGFDDQEPNEHLRALFRMPDLDPLSGFGCKVKRTAIERSLEVEGTILNVTHLLDAEGRAEVLFNFHHDATTAEIAGNLLDDRAEKCLKLARDFMSKVYECSLEDVDEQL